MRKALVAVVLAVTSALAAGCKNPQDEADAKALVAQHFDAISHQAYNRALLDYGPKFFSSAMTSEEWRATLESIERKLGAFRKYDIVGTSWRNQFGKNAGTFIELKCRVSYAKYEADEAFYTLKPSGETKFMIVGHHINSKGLLKE